MPFSVQENNFQEVLDDGLPLWIMGSMDGAVPNPEAIKEENFMKLTDLEATVFYGLMRNHDGRPYGGWARTDSNNASMTSGVKGEQFAEALASLVEKGLYRNAGDDVCVIDEVFVDGEPYLYTEDEVAA